MDCVLHRQQAGFVRCTSILLSTLLLSSAAASDVVAESASAEKCDTPGSEAAPGSNLLQISSKTAGHDDNFGPGRCVGLKRSGTTGSCVLQTNCHGQNISDTEFAFVCFNPGESMPHALHSFGRGGFAYEEMFDTKVRCKTCISLDTAFRTGDSVMRNALAALPLSRLPSLQGVVQGTGVYSVAELAQFKPKEAAVFGPDFCISTFLAPAGTCLIRTRCAGVDLSKFNIGVTCLDQSGGYTRYVFGKDSFKAEETFDTLVTCEQCLGVGPESSQSAMHGLMPRKLVEDVNTLKVNVETLNEKVRVLQEHSAKSDGRRRRTQADIVDDDVIKNRRRTTQSRMPEAPRKPLEPENGLPPMPEHPHKGELFGESEAKPAESSEAPIPTIMMSRRQDATRPGTTDLADEREPEEFDEAQPMQEAEPEPSSSTGHKKRRRRRRATVAAGAETAALDMGAMQIVTHRRGNIVAELLRRAAK